MRTQLYSRNSRLSRQVMPWRISTVLYYRYLGKTYVLLARLGPASSRIVTWNSRLYTYRALSGDPSSNDVCQRPRRLSGIPWRKFFSWPISFVLQWLQITELSHIFVLYVFRNTVCYIRRHSEAWWHRRMTRNFSYAQTVFVSLFFLMIIKTRLAPEVSVAFGTRDLNPCGYIWRACLTVITRLI